MQERISVCWLPIVSARCESRLADAERDRESEGVTVEMGASVRARVS